MATSRELAEQAFSLLQDALKDTEAKAAELDAELKKNRAPKNQLEHQIQVLEHRLETIQADSQSWHREVVQLKELLENERAKSKQLRKKLEIAESGPDKVGKKEVNYWRSRAEQFDADTEQYKQRIVELNKQLQEALEEAGSADAKLDEQIRERDAQLAEQNARIAALEAEAAERARQLDELGEAHSRIEAERRAAQDKLTTLESELRQEAECTINLSQIANERREEITQLSEKLDEALERYEEAKWQLERASRFERIVNKRRKLIDSLIEGLRAKQKSNTALKAGIDGLRRFKAKAEEQQQKLLVRIEDLSSELKEAREQLAIRRKSDQAEEQLRRATETISSLEDKLNAQAQAVDTLEAELAAARAARRSADIQTEELAELRAAVEAKNETIATLETEMADLREQLAASIDSESDTMRLDALRENGGDPALTAELRKRDSQIADLKRRLKDQDKEIAKLNDVAAGWQKKYEFVTAETPSAYQSAAGEK